MTHLRQNCINDSNAIDTLRRIYDKNSLNANIECELIVCAVDNIIYNALHEK